MLRLFKLKNLLKLIWFAFGASGIYLIAREYWPNFPQNLKDSALVKGVQSRLIEQRPDSDYSGQELTLKDIKNLDPQQAAEVISTVINREIKNIIEQTTTEVKQFPAKQVRKIKIGACEELLEEDICSVAKEINCGN